MKTKTENKLNEMSQTATHIMRIEPQPQPSAFTILRNRVITGLFVVIPIFITIYVAWIIYSMLTEWAVFICSETEVFEKVPIPDFWQAQIIRLISLITIICLLAVVGQLAKMAFGKKIISIAQATLLKVPLVNFIYSTIKQIGDALWSSSGGMFRQVVLFEYPCKGTYAVGFLTNENNEESFEINKRLKTHLVSVFMPTTPNPTSGFLFFIPRENCIMLDMSVSDAMKLIVSVGAVTPNSTPVPNPAPQTVSHQQHPN